MKILFQEKRKVNEAAIVGYFASRGVAFDPTKVQLIDIDKVDLTTCDPDYYVLSGYETYAKLTTLVHMGFRKTPDWNHIKMLKVIRLNNGSELIIADGSLEDLYDKLDMLLTGAVPMSHKPLANNITLTDPDAIIDTLRYIIKTYEPGELTGFDYETTGLYNTDERDNKNFRATGVSVSIKDYGWFFDFRFLGSRKKEVMEVFREFCVLFQQNIYAFNAEFEYMTTVFEADVACEFSDLRHFWVEDGYHMDWATFKYIARYYLHVPSWDDDFELMSETFGAFYSLVDRHEGSWEAFLNLLKRWTVSHYLTEDDINIKKEDLIVDTKNGIDEPKTISDMALILTQFTEEDMTEFRYLCNSPEWNVSGFGIIPSRFLGHYCNLDAYYTKESVAVNQGKYSQLCDDVYRDNGRFGMTINSTGVVKDQDAYNDTWRVLNQKLSHEGYILTMHAMRKKVEDIEAGKRISNILIKGFPRYTTLAPTNILAGGKSSRGKWPNHPSQYSIIPFEGLGGLDHDDGMYSMMKWVYDWTNPYSITQGLFKRILDWELLSGKQLNIKDEVFPDWANNEYHYWNVFKLADKIFKDRSKYPIVDVISKGDWVTFKDKFADYRFLVHDIAEAVHGMMLEYNFNKVKNACQEWYELKQIVEPASYYDQLANKSEPIYLNAVNIPTTAPGFIYDIMNQGYGLDNIYYYTKELIARLVDPAYERNYNENLAWELFNNYIPEDKNYKTFKDEVDDWLFWKDKELSESVAKRISVVRGLSKVFERVIKETVGDINQEEFAMTAELISAKKLMEDLLAIPEFKTAKRHDDLPDTLHFRGIEWSLFDFQILLIRNTLGLTGPVSYDEFMNRYLDDYMLQNKFSLFIGQYADIYDRYMKKTDVSELTWLEQFTTEFNEFDLSKVFVIDDKDLTQRTQLSWVKLLLANEFKNLLSEAMLICQNVQADHSRVQELIDMAKKIGDEIPKFQFMVIDHGDQLQVMVYDAKQSDGKFRVLHQDYDDGKATVDELLVEFNTLVSRSFDMVKNIIQWDSLTDEQKNDFLKPYGSLINSLVAPVFGMYKDKLKIEIKDYKQLIQICNDMLTDTDKSWIVNERLNMTDWLVRHMYTVSYLTDRYGEEFTDNFVDYLDSMDIDMDHPLYPYKIMFMQRMFKKDNKALTYLTGMLKDYDTYFDEIDEFTMLGTRWSENPSSAKWIKMMAPWGCNNLASKRWSGPLTCSGR